MDNLEKYFPDPASESPEILIERSPAIVGRLLKRAVENIDREFGHGYARENPELVGAFLQASVADFNARSRIQNFQTVASVLHETLDGFFDLAFETARQVKG